MKVQISATAPTVYQIQSLRQFGMGCTANGNGSYSATMLCDTMEEAKKYLMSRSENYFEDAYQLKIAKRDIRLYGILRLDAISASIEKI